MPISIPISMTTSLTEALLENRAGLCSQDATQARSKKCTKILLRQTSTFLDVEAFAARLQAQKYPARSLLEDELPVCRTSTAFPLPNDCFGLLGLMLLA